MGMKAEFRPGRWIGFEVVEKDERLDQFANIARTDQSGNRPMRVSTRAHNNLPGGLFSPYRTREHCIGLHFRSPEVWLSLKAQPLTRCSKATSSSRRRKTTSALSNPSTIAATGLLCRMNTWVATAHTMVKPSHSAAIE